MDNLKIVVFLCNWGPHAAFQTLQDTCCAIPREVRMVRIPCSGRISKSLLFKAFEMGADGVALIGCETGTCRYGSGTDNTTHNVESTRGILEMLGIGEERLRWATFLPEDAAGLLHFLQNFQKDVHTLGKNPVVPPAHDLHVLAPSRPHALAMADDSARKLLAEHDIYACQDCGKCSSACPITLLGKPFSPRAMAGRIIANGMSDPAVDADIWSCLTCGLCHDRCPSAIDFPEFIRELRALESAGGSAGHEAHGGFFQSLMRTMTSPDLPIRHWDWLPADVRTDPQSKILFFGGCAP